MARRLEVEVAVDAAKYASGLRNAEKQTGRFSKAARVAGLAITGSFVVGLKKSVDAAMDAQRVQALTENQLKSLGISYKAHAKQIDSVIQSTSKLAAIDDEELQGAFNDLVRSTGNVNKALKETQLAADLARGGHMALGRATKLLQGAEAGRVKGLQRYVGVLPTITAAQDALVNSHKKYTDAQMDAAKATDVNATKQAALSALQSKFAGAAEAYGKTAAGSQERLGIAIENLEESLGSLLLPTITKVATAMGNLAEYFEKHKTLAKALAVGVGVLGSVLLAASVATKTMAAAQTLLNLAMLANPVGIVIVALVALGAALVVAWKKSETFRTVVTGTWDAIRIGAQALLGFFRTNWPVITTLISGPFIPLVALATNAFGIRSALLGAFEVIKTRTRDLVHDVAGFWGDLPAAVGRAVSGKAQALWNAVKGIFAALPKFIRDALDIHSPSKEFEAIGVAIMEGAIKGIKSLKDVLLEAAWEAFSQVIGVAKETVKNLGKEFHDTSGEVAGPVIKMVVKADQIDKAHYPYAWGGGHNSSFSPSRATDGRGTFGYDCSGAVSAVLHAGGLLGSPMVSGDLARWGAGGFGHYVTVFADAVHTFMSLLGKGFGTSQENGGGGAGWLSFNSPYRSGFSTRHPPGLYAGGYVAKTGLAVVHEGETFSGVGKTLGGDVHVHLHGNYVDNKQALIRDVRDGIVQAGRRNGGGMLASQG